MNAFKPYVAYAPVSQALDGSSHALALPQMARSGDVVRVAVIGTSSAKIWFGFSDGATARMTLQPASVELFTLDTGVTHIAVDGESGSTVEITMGVGI